MTAKKQINRQMVLAIMVAFTFKDIAAGVQAKLPPGALLLRVGYKTVTAFDGTGTVTGSVSDGTTTFVNAENIKTTGDETVANTPKYYPTGGTLTFSAADQNSNSAAGLAIAYAEYMVLGNSDEIYG